MAVVHSRDFSRYDEYAVLQIPRNIELLRYRRYGGDLLLLELVRASTTVPHAKALSLDRGGPRRNNVPHRQPTMPASRKPCRTFGNR